MHNIHELEKRWRNYKIKKYLPHVGAIVTTILLIIYVFKTIDITEIKEEQNSIKEKKIEKIVTQEKEPKKEFVQAKKKIDSSDDKALILNPSLDFMKNLQTNSIATYEPKVEKTQTQNIKSINKEKKSEEKDKVLEIKEKIPTLTLIKQDTIDDINLVIKRFKKSNNPALSLFIAKKYYKLKKYHKAYNYALITNAIDKDIDESWILFSKSLIKLGKKDMAINTLTKYIEQSDSINAKVLLDNIKSGKFK